MASTTNPIKSLINRILKKHYLYNEESKKKKGNSGLIEIKIVISTSVKGKQLIMNDRYFLGGQLYKDGTRMSLA